MDSNKNANQTLNYRLRTTNRRKMRQGLTLVELLVSLSLTGIVTLLILTVYNAYFKLFTNQIGSTDVIGQNQIATQEIINQIRQSQSVILTCPDNICQADNTGQNVIVLELWSLDAGGNATSAAFDYFVYRTDANDSTSLIKKIYADPSSSRKTAQRIITHSLQPSNGLSFSYNPAVPDTTQVTITLSTTGTLNGKTQTSTKTATAGLRNK